VLSCQYNSAGELSSQSAAIDGTPDFLDTLHYDAFGRVVSITQTGQPGGDAVTPVEVDFSYNSAQDQVTLSRYQNGQFVAQSTYQYNNLGELISLVHSQGANILASYSYSYSNVPGVSASPFLGGGSPFSHLQPSDP